MVMPPLRFRALGALRVRTGVALSVVLLAVGGTTPAPGDEGRAPAALRFVGLDAVDPFDPRVVDADRLARLSGLGLVQVRTVPVPWGRIEPHPPVLDGRHLRDWEALDTFMAAWGDIGTDVVLVVSPASPWAGADVETSACAREIRERLPEREAASLLRSLGAAPPSASGWAPWERFLQDLAERYDGDGVADAKPLPRRLPWIQVLDHPARPACFAGSAQDYLRILHLASQGVARASDVVRVAHGSVDFATLGHDPWPDEAEMLRRLEVRHRDAPAGTSWWARREVEFSLFTLSMRRLFGAVSHAGSAHNADEVADLRTVRRLLDEAGRPDLEVWLVDAPAAHLGPSELVGVEGPDAAERQVRSRWSAKARWPAGEEGVAARAWAERGQAHDAIRTVCRARQAGAACVFLGGGESPLGTRGLDLVVVEDGNGGWRRTPTWYALRQMNERLLGHRTVEGVAPGRGVEAYRFRYPAGSAHPWVLALFLDDAVTWAGRPGETGPRREVRVPLPDGDYVVEEAALAPGEPALRRVRVEDGLLQLDVGPAPLYVYPDA